MGYNLFGAGMFALVGTLRVDSCLDLMLELYQVSPDWNVEGTDYLQAIQRDNNMALMSAILCFVNAFLYAVDTVVEIVALRDSY